MPTKNVKIHQFSSSKRQHQDSNIIEPDFDDNISYSCSFNGIDFDIEVADENISVEKLDELKIKHSYKGNKIWI